MLRLRERYAQHDQAAEHRLKEAFAFANKRPPIVVNDVNYWLFGELPELIPDGYCSDRPQIMMDYQLNKIRRHFELYPDDCYQPFLMPWFGTGVLASAFGTRVSFLPGMDPAVDMSTVSDPDFIATLKLPDPERDGIMPLVLKAIDHFAANCDLPIGVTDCQGPLTTALSIIGYENFAYWTMDYPDAIHSLMQTVTDALIEWVRVQKRRIGVADEEPGYILGVHMPEGSGGVWISDDDAVILGESLYREFVVPYNSQVLKAFGGGGIHCCGSVDQHRQNLVDTEGLTCYNNFTLDGLDSALRLQKTLASKKIPLMVCDFVPQDDRIESYYGEIAERFDPQGLVVSAYVAPATALSHGKYLAANRDAEAIGKRVRQTLEVLYR